MKPVCRLNDKSSGHGPYPPQAILSGSSNVFINGRPVAAKGDELEPHPTPDPAHTSKLSSGSSTVYVNGKPINRIGDSVSCGGFMVNGSSNVFSG